MQEIKEKIVTMSESELADLAEFIHNVRKNLQANKDILAASKFKVGDKVSFDSRRSGKRVVIVIDKINPKNLSGSEVGASFNKWKVSPSLCRLES